MPAALAPLPRPRVPAGRGAPLAPGAGPACALPHLPLAPRQLLWSGRRSAASPSGLPTCVWRLSVACELSSRGSLSPRRDEAWLRPPCGAASSCWRPTCGQEEEEDEERDGGGRLGAAVPTVPASPAPRQPRVAPFLTWLLFCRLGSPSAGWERAFASSSMGIFGVLCRRPAMGTQGRCCLLLS